MDAPSRKRPRSKEDSDCLPISKRLNRLYIGPAGIPGTDCSCQQPETSCIPGAFQNSVNGVTCHSHPQPGGATHIHPTHQQFANQTTSADHLRAGTSCLSSNESDFGRFGVPYLQGTNGEIDVRVQIASADTINEFGVIGQRYEPDMGCENAHYFDTNRLLFEAHQQRQHRRKDISM